MGRFLLPRVPRRILKLLEAFVNLSALTVRFMVSPPEVIHVQLPPMLKWCLPPGFLIPRVLPQTGLEDSSDGPRFVSAR